MKVTLVGPEIEESLALRYLAGALEAVGHAWSIVAFNETRDLGRVARTVLRERPALVGFSLVAQRRYGDMQALIARLRAAGFTGHITAGGHFASLRSGEVMRDTPGLDSILHHDGEQRIVALAAALEQRPADGRDRTPDGARDGLLPGARGGLLPGAMEGITWRDARGAVQHRAPLVVIDLDRLAPPARGRPGHALGVPLAPLVTSRGCSGACSFCSIHAWHGQVPGKRLRYREPEHVVREMAALHREHGVRLFVFHDDDFIHPDRRRALARCRAILEPARERIGQRFAFVIKCRPDGVEEELFAYLKSRGLARAFVGIESHSQAGLSALNRRVTPETNIRALEILQGLDIYACFNLLFFHPDSTLAELRENLEFLERHVSVPFDLGRTELYARAGLEERMVAEGRAIGDYRGYDYRIADPVAERAFRLFLHAMGRRHFAPPLLLHRTQDLGFRCHMARRLYPGSVSAETAGKVDALLREVNLDSVRFLNRLVGAAEEGGAGAWRVAEEVRREAMAKSRRQMIRLALLSVELEARARAARRAEHGTHPATRARRILGRVAAAGSYAGLAFGAVSCFLDRGVVCDPTPPPLVRFSIEVEPDLLRTCATADCHSAQAAAGDLALTAGHARDQLVNVPSRQVPRLKLVEPGSPDSSYLVQKMEGTQRAVGGAGDPMPPPGSAMSDTLLSKILAWIGQGARKN